ncbi:hypothetical protein [Actinoplanes sp. NPDC051494]|uniref:hypothetical protein n=1 Tax=Actinoplanes sp. NPDC051494 TaxID=3363907 RepID=UPI0037BA20D1
MTEHASPLRADLTTFPRTLGWVAGLAVLSGGAYWALLGWDSEKDFHPDTNSYTGPWSAWQVLGLAAIVGLLAFAAGRAGRPGLATAVIPVAITTGFVVTASTDPQGDGLWPIGAALVALGTVAGVVLVAYVTRALSQLRRPSAAS